MDFDVSKIYNPEMKLSFLDDYTAQESTKEVVFNTFKRTFKTEQKLKKDVFEMTDEELEMTLLSANVPSVASMISFYSNLNNYISWVSEKYNTNQFTRFGGVPFSQIAHKYVIGTSNSFYTQEDLINYYELMHNQVDKFIIQSIFEGVCGEAYVELSHLKISDFKEEEGKYYVDISNTRDGADHLEISKLLYDLAFKVDEEQNYMGDNDLLNPLFESDYLIKRPKSRRANEGFENEPVDRSLFNNRAKIYRDIFHPNKFTYRLIIQSGIMHRLYEIIKDKPLDAEGIEITFDDLDILSDKFNIGKYIHSVTLKETVAHARIRDKIDKKFFEENYCKFHFQLNKRRV